MAEQRKYADLNSLQQFLLKLKDMFSFKEHKHTLEDITDYVVDTSLSKESENPVQNKVITEGLEGKVPIERTVNGKSLHENITLAATDVGADVEGSAAQALTDAKAHTDTEVNKLSAMVAYIDENDNETVTLSVDLTDIAQLLGGDA